jgi:nitrite reductase (NO-forming)
MTRSRTYLIAAMTAVLLVTVAGWTMSVRARSQFDRGPGEYVIDGKVFGMPEADVFMEEYDGPPVVGDIVTRLPHLAKLEPGNRTHHVRVDIVAMEIEIAPGVRYEAWTFGGTVPGPALHVREGDRVVFTMKNRTGERVSLTAPQTGSSPFLQQLARNIQEPVSIEAPMPHSMDFHSATVAPDDKWRIVQPDETIRFEWVANYPGVYMYHCGVPPVLQHVAMGQYGVVVVSPRHGYPTDAQTAREYAVVQSEFYLQPGDGPLHHFDFEAALQKNPSHVTFNGHVRALTDEPLTANAGERVRLYLLNAGPNDQSSMHVIGAIFDRVFYEGNPRNDWHGMQTLVLGASNGAVVEFIAPEEGTYVLVDHEFADATKGAVGLIKVRSQTGTLTRRLTEMSH